MGRGGGGWKGVGGRDAHDVWVCLDLYARKRKGRSAGGVACISVDSKKCCPSPTQALITMSVEKILRF